MADGQPDPELRGRDLVGLGGMLAAAVVAGLLLGLLADHLFDSSPVGVLVGIGLGVVAGCLGFWVRVRSVLS
jgi:F0F1-type ATP synthase assembly protein I